MPEQTNAPMLPVDVAHIERDTAGYCQGCGRDPGDCGPVVRYLFPLHGLPEGEADYDKLYFCRDCSLLVSGAIEELWHQYDLTHSRSNNHYLLQRAAYHLTQATLMLARMDA